ncbi:MAG: ParB/RepB/Spo0J family partition protein [Chitinispirillaceae bacterium]|jgi:ParB family chromosome partitioning protein
MNKKVPRRVLGRGLSALIPVTPQEGTADEHEIVDIDCAAIRPNPYQPRAEINNEEIKGLAESISVQGLLQPILVRQKGNNEFEIISGERRFRALQVLGRDKIPCLIKQKLSDREMMEIALVENIQREDLNEIDKADAYQKLITEYNYTHEALSKQMGKSRTAITNTLRLRTLQQEIQLMVRKNMLSMGHARALLAIEDDKMRIELAKKIVEEDLSVREVEKKVQKLIRGKKGKHKKETATTNLDPNVTEAINRLQYKLGTAVTIKPTTEQQGKVEIEYYSEKDLVRIFDLLLVETK